MSYQYQFGGKVVYSNGKIFVGSERSQAFLGLFCIAFPPLLTFVLKLYEESLSFLSNFSAISTVLLLIITILTYLFNGLTDPGFVSRRANEPPANEMSKSLLISESETMEYKNRTFTMSFCIICKFHRPLRVHHCRTCGVCVEEMDHHCPWIGNCVGRRTRGTFIWFLILILSLNISVLIVDFAVIDIEMSEAWENIHSWCSIYIVVHISLVSLFCSSLLVVQIVLISKGITTAEYLKKYWKGLINPFDEGCLRNWKNFMQTDRSAKSVTIEDIKYLHREKHNENHLLNDKEIQGNFIQNTNTHLSLEMSHKNQKLLDFQA